MTTYSALLRDPRWQKKRLEILNRDEFTCRDCFSEERTLHVHHVHYEYGLDPWEYEDSLLVTLCENCHARETANAKRAKQRLMTAMCRYGMLAKSLNELADAFEHGHFNGGYEPDVSRLAHAVSDSDGWEAVRGAFDRYLNKNRVTKTSAGVPHG